MIHQVLFDSITEIPEWINAHPQYRHDSSTSMSADRSWDRGVGFDGSMQMAKDGGYWEEGTQAMIKATSDMAALKQDGLVTALDYDVIGHTLDVGTFLSGDPECWEQELPEVPKPVIKIGVQQYTPGGNDEREFMYRGAAILSCIEDLEDQGIRVELWGCVSGIHRGSKGKDGIDMRTCLKRAEESYSPASVAFGLAHASFSRRLGFRVAEAFQSLNECGFLPGHSLDFKNDRPIGSDFDVWFGYNSMVEHTYKSAAHALELVQTEIKRQLEEKDYADAGEAA